MSVSPVRRLAGRAQHHHPTVARRTGQTHRRGLAVQDVLAVATGIHPRCHHSRQGLLAKGDILSPETVFVTCALQPLGQVGSVRACVAHEPVAGHILGMGRGCRLKLAVIAQRRAAICLTLRVHSGQNTGVGGRNARQQHQNGAQNCNSHLLPFAQFPHQCGLAPDYRAEVNVYQMPVADHLSSFNEHITCGRRARQQKRGGVPASCGDYARHIPYCNISAASR
mmetsp:Transcript_23745/g.42567  ORF Transcript_23745/g.42567 Transcript_23745/m.42567 type:complete len:224 (+) Transcript_23745:1345-2016(+)